MCSAHFQMYLLTELESHVVTMRWYWVRSTDMSENRADSETVLNEATALPPSLTYFQNLWRS